jgi:hypothetical protein
MTTWTPKPRERLTAVQGTLYFADPRTKAIGVDTALERLISFAFCTRRTGQILYLDG